ncbi:MAG: Site-specific recombinase [Parcubacteria bacterium C7867-008]|nr:MAG: Site-specific recombinase [Parcubacteria bacterium C7867-008]
MSKKPKQKSNITLQPTSASVEEHAVIYCRVSSDKQASEGHGMEAQEARCREYAQQRSYQIDEVFQDVFTGGGDFRNRAGVVQLLKYLDKFPHRSYVVLFDDMKRIARDTQAYLELRLEIEARGARPESPNFAFNEGPEARFIETIHAAQAQLEREQNRRQVIQKMKARMEAGYYCIGGTKRGYQRNKTTKVLEPSREGLDVLKPALEAFADGKLVRKVDMARYLIDKGFWKRPAPESYITQVTSLLEDPFYAGYVEHIEWEVSRRPGHHKGLISPNTYEATQARLQKVQVSKWVRQDISSDFPLRGLINCVCGASLTAAFSKNHNGNRYPYYLCKTAGCVFKNKSIKKAELEGNFLKVMHASKLKPSVSKVVEEVFRAVWKEEIAEVGKREATHAHKIEKLREKLRGLADMAYRAKTEQLRDVYEHEMEQTAREIEGLEAESGAKLDFAIPFQTALKKSKTLVERPYSIWTKLNTREQHSLYFFLFDEKLFHCK